MLKAKHTRKKKKQQTERKKYYYIYKINVNERTHTQL